MAESMLPCPVKKMTRTAGRYRLISFKACSPSMSGILRSRMTTSMSMLLRKILTAS
jgi:hypothetical protein